MMLKLDVIVEWQTIVQYKEILQIYFTKITNSTWIYNNKWVFFIGGLLVCKYVHFMTYIVPYYDLYYRKYLRKPPVIDH
jgi:hypothetical protein